MDNVERAGCGSHIKHSECGGGDSGCLTRTISML